MCSTKWKVYDYPIFVSYLPKGKYSSFPFKISESPCLGNSWFSILRYCCLTNHTFKNHTWQATFYLSSAKIECGKAKQHYLTRSSFNWNALWYKSSKTKSLRQVLLLQKIIVNQSCPQALVLDDSNLRTPSPWRGEMLHEEVAVQQMRPEVVVILVQLLEKSKLCCIAFFYQFW